VNVNALHLWSAVLAGDAARRLGLLEVLAESDATAEELALRCGLDVRGCRTLLDALVSFELVEQVRDQYRAPELLPLVERSLASISARMQGAPPTTASDRVDGAGQSYPKMVGALGRSYGALPVLAAPFLRSRRLLDVGAGSAAWSIAVADLEPNCRVTALDLESVMPVTRAHVEDAGHTDRFSFCPGDLFELSLPESTFDVVLLAQVCHLFGESRLRALFDHLRPAVAVGGRIAILDRLRCNGQQSRAGAVHDLSLFARTDEGQAHAFSSFAGWLQEAGFVDIGRHTLSAEVSIVYATRAS